VRKGEHINKLELRAVLNASRWRLRSERGLRQRYLHLVDSQVVAGVLAKGRSSSYKLKIITKKISALHLAGFVWPLWGYLHTDDNPSDVPSRWRWLKKRRQVAQPSHE